MSAGNFTLYNNAKLLIANGGIDLDGHSFKAALVTSSYTPSASHTVPADFTSAEVSGGGYAQVAVPSISVTESSGTVTVTSAAINFGTITATAKYIVLYDDTHISDALLGYMDLSSGGGSVSSTAGTFQVSWNASGMFTLA